MVRRKFLSSREARLVLYHPNFVLVKITAQGKPSAEVKQKYFCTIKISTRMLISLWKSRVGALLTSRVSTLFS